MWVVVAFVPLTLWLMMRRRDAARGASPALTKAQSQARVKQLRAQGYKVKLAKLKDGTTVVLRSKTRAAA